MRRLLPRFARRRRPPIDDDVPRADRFGFLDLLTEATSDIGTRPGRLSMTVAGTVLGIAALVATIGFSQTATDQIARQFDAASATQIVVTPAKTSSQGGTSVATARLPWDAPERVERLAGVEAAALSTKVDLGTGTISAVSVDDPSAPTIVSPALFAASAGVLDMVGGHLVTGRSFDDGHDRRGDRVALLGASAAANLGVDRVDTQPSIFIDGVAYAVIGIFDGVDTAGELLDAAVVPNGAARRDFGVRAPGDLRARIAVGAGPQLRDQVPLTLSPDAPETIVVGAPPGTSELSTGVQSDVGFVFVLLGVVVLLAGGLGIANVTMMSVMERVTEIGLRRALGATRKQIAGQFVIESIVIGTLGGLIGSSLGVFAVVGVSVAQQWTPVLDPLVAVGGALLGAVVGLVAGGIPARRAARIEPVDALRGS